MTNTIYQPYFYIIQHSVSGMYYAGSKYGKDANPKNFMIENGYTTSSDTINTIVVNKGIDIFNIIKVRTFETGEDAYDYETRFLNKVDAMNNPMFYNRSNNNGVYPNRKKSSNLEFNNIACSNSTTHALSILGNIIRIARKERGISQVELSERAGMSRATLQKIEKGLGEVRIGTVFECCFILGIDIFGGDKEYISNLSSMLMYMNRLLPDRVIKEHTLDDNF